ncbi:hypothetical protein [Janthinobacterium sp.]|uniref:hypothetical protein n=1 Tax=Janthinobacterium sp. TaxID=1871054 RepID=UPI00293D2571|nr:hypothetical protein [Janthinobacterium sp.]
MDKNRASMLKITTLALALSLVGCGGGGSSDTPGPTTSAARTVSGTAAKGILQGATVKVFAIAADGTQGGTAIVSGTTGADGTFSLSIPADVLSFIVEVSGGPNAVTVDEATGLDVPISATFKLHSVVKLASADAGAYTGSVSPLTEMIVQTALAASGGLSDANISSAKTGFAAFFGFDPEKVTPVNSNLSGAASASADEKLQSVLLAAISKMAKDGKLGCAGTDGEKLACVVGGIGKLAKINGSSLEVNDSLSGAIDTAATEVLADTKINKTGNTTILPLPKGSVPIVPPAANGLLAAKALFASLRSNLTALSNAGNSGAIDIRADAMRADFDQATAPLDQDLAKWMQLTTNGIDFLRAYKAGNDQVNTLEVYSGGMKIGGCNIYSDTSGNTPATAAGNAAAVGCSVIRKNVPGSQTFGLEPNTYKRVTAAFTIVPASDTAYTYVARARLETWNVGANERNRNLDVTLGNYGSTSDSRATGTITYVKSGDTISSLVVNGSMPARTDEFGVALTDRETWSLSASRSAEGGNLYKYAISGSIASVRKDAEVGKVSIADGSFVRTEESVAGHVVSGGVREFSLGLAAEAGGSKVAGTLTMTKAMADKGGHDYMPTDVSFTGSLSTASAEFFSGTLHFTQTGYAQFDSTLPESAANFVAKNATLVGKLSIKDRPTLGLSLNASNTAFHHSSLTGQYNDGSSLINFSVSDNGAATKVTLISSADGVTVSVKDGSETVEVLKGGVKVAVLNTKNGHIDYADGSFESLK